MTAARRLDILSVDDDPGILAQLRGVLEDQGHAVTLSAVRDARAAFEALERGHYDVILLDIEMPGMSGLEALPMLREMAPDTAVVVVSGQGSVANAVLATKRGAFDFVEKGAELASQLPEVIRQAAQLTALRRGGAAPGKPADTLGILGSSAPVAALLADIRRVAPTSARVLITGENGAGKELVAHAIHQLSRRAAQPFEKLNCAALPRELVESELFGHEKGSFTGALARKTGRFERAQHGTLFLDEVGDLAPEAQAKLLRAIETGEIDRVGGGDAVKVDVRVIAATNRDLRAAIAEGAFREDLYHRLAVIELRVPALRERRGDIALLARHFLDAACATEGLAAKTLDAEALELLEGYRWPGNVRELSNVMERAAILVDGAQVRAADLTAWLETEGPAAEAPGLRGEIERREVDTIQKALRDAGWNVKQAADALGIDRTNLHRKMRKYGLRRP